MIDLTVPLVAHDGEFASASALAGPRGLLVVGVGRAAGRGFQLLNRFAETSERLAAAGVGIVFVFAPGGARHAFDPMSVRGARYRQRRCLFVDAHGRFLREPVPALTLRAIWVDDALHARAALDIGPDEAQGDAALAAFVAEGLAGCVAHPLSV